MTIAERKERLAIVQKELAEYREARSFILKGGQSYTLNDQNMQRSVTNADLSVINTQILRLEREERSLISAISSGRPGGIYRVV